MTTSGSCPTIIVKQRKCPLSTTLRPTLRWGVPPRIHTEGTPLTDERPSTTQTPPSPTSVPGSYGSGLPPCLEDPRLTRYNDLSLAVVAPEVSVLVPERRHSNLSGFTRVSTYGNRPPKP